MPLRHRKNIKYSPGTVCDSEDGTDGPEGGMQALANLIPDITTSKVFVPRPGCVEQFDVSTLSAALGTISVLLIDGNLVYGMAQSVAYPTLDYPFCYNLTTMAFVAITGATTGNTPLYQNPANSTFLPPAMAVVSTKVMLAHAGFSNGNGPIGWLDISTPTAPVWHSGNTSTYTLPGVPQWVNNFNNRAYYAIGNQEWYSDPLVPTNMTNAGQAVTLGDTTSVVGACGLPLNSTQIGGMVQSLLIFKEEIIYQLSGDAALSGTLALQVSSISVGIGSPCANSLTPTPEGTAFMSYEGVRIVNFLAQISAPIGKAGQGITQPFISMVNPWLTNMAYNAGILRVTCNTFQNNVTAPVEYWYDVVRKIWIGPHSCTAYIVVEWNNTFLINRYETSVVYQSDAIPSANSVYTEFGSPMGFDFWTTLSHDNEEMTMNAIIETTFMCAFQGASGAMTVSFLNENSSILDTVYINPGVSPTVWDGFLWGAADWLGVTQPLQQIRIPWDQPVVFKQGSFQATGTCVSGMKFGNVYLGVQPQGYLLP